MSQLSFVHWLCEQCHQPLEGKREWTGRRSQCPRCGNVMTVPAGANAESAPNPFHGFLEQHIVDRVRDLKEQARQEDIAAGWHVGYLTVVLIESLADV